MLSVGLDQVKSIWIGNLSDHIGVIWVGFVKLSCTGRVRSGNLKALCTLDLIVKYVILNLRSRCRFTDIVIIFMFFAGPIRSYSPGGRVNNF